MYAQYLVHLGYTLQLFALLARDVLWLRSLLILAQSVLAAYAWTRGLWPYVFWNGLFVSINCFWVARLLRERAAVMLPDDLAPLYERHFAALTPPEFMRIWREGERRKTADVRLVREGTRPEALYFILDGVARVSRNGRVLAQLPAGNFIAEMSLLTGEKTTADVDAAGPIEFMCWPTEKLVRIRSRNAMLWSKIQSVLGHDLVEKIRRSTTMPETAAAQPPS